MVISVTIFFSSCRRSDLAVSAGVSTAPGINHLYRPYHFGYDPYWQFGRVGPYAPYYHSGFHYYWW
ncbi:MAG: hypothetical protein ACK40G_00220 [Cytophagaceae bacterium]